MNDIKFSIIIPAFKEQYLEYAIKSVLCQKYDNWELIILNDRSPYNLDTIVLKFGDKRIRYLINEENIGAENVVNNWNKCLDVCTGDYVICMGDDDALHEDCLSVYLRYINNYPEVSLFHTRSIIIDEYNVPQYITNSRPEKESIYSLMKHRMIEEQFIGDFCFKSTTLRRRGGFFYLPLAWGSDDVSAYLCAMDGGVVNVQLPVFYYRKSTINITSTGNVGKKLDSLNTLYEWYMLFLKQVPDAFVDKLERASVLNRIEKYFFQRKAEDLSMDIRLNYFHVISWIFRKKRYSLSISCILYGLLISLFVRNRKRHS